MSSWHEFIFMGKHGAYVWSSYFMTFVVLIGLFVCFRIMLKSLRKQVIEESKLDSSRSGKARKLKVSKTKNTE